MAALSRTALPCPLWSRRQTPLASRSAISPLATCFVSWWRKIFLAMPDSATKPLLTFAVAGFNQEPFVEEAVKAAFAQTYSPLEIILSDDCSKDRTFEIMREMAASYRGPHRVVLNRNPVQRSIGGHLNRLVEL